ncbi:CbtA family protein [Pseudomonas syringae group genomosp. 3]|uniref:CbtA family protein n=1 Tax=Pseudomonas syringae group genomosp. 3 TaxID=251701 RepID=UPI0028902DBC|nr:CbtA family protein [Pseudomonas syringae group genomosp. 3]MDT3236546.1 CbtA family protein [Pseudomonas syringae pv. tomato]
MFKRIAQTAGFTGLLAALLLTLLQSFWVVPLIQQAETYEKAPAEHVHEHADGAVAEHSHAHDEAAWEPEDGWQRVLSTTGGNLVVAVGFAVFVLAPTLGLPPELPGTAAAELSQRQLWWIGTAASTAAGLALLVFGQNWRLKVLGAAILVVPHVIGAPQPLIHESLAPEALESQFRVASLLTNALFWVALGLISAWLFRRSNVHTDNAHSNHA